MTTLAEPAAMGELAESITVKDGRCSLRGIAGWWQGRTMYGGASSFLAYAAARRAMPDLPPLRGAQVGFIAPVGGDLDIVVTPIRRGRSVTQVQTDILCEGALAHRSLWMFGAARPANGAVAARQEQALLPVTDAPPIPAPEGDFFIRNLDLRRGTAKGDARPATIRRWARLKDRRGIDPVGELVLLGDALPSGAMRAMERQGPISSMNWSLTLLGDAPRTTDGWWLLETASNHMADGFSSETLRMWNADGVEVMRGLQSVAIFG
ncbi:MAG: thioesterase family protein [Novosphingobium sp.]